MLRVSYIIILCFFEILTIYLITRISKQKSELHRAFKVLITIACIIVVVNICALVEIFPEPLALFFQAHYYAGFDFMMLNLMRVIHIFTTKHTVSKKVWYPLIAISWIDATSMMVNVFTHHVFTSYHTQMSLTGETVRAFATNTLFFEFHLYFCYCMAAGIMLLLVFKLNKTYGIYYKQYLVVTVLLIVLLFLDAGYVYLHQPLNLSLLFYLGGIMVLYYYMTTYVPRKLNTETLILATHAMGNAVVCFDAENNPTFVSKATYDLLGIPEGKTEYVGGHFVLEDMRSGIQKGLSDWYQTELERITPFRREDWETESETHYEIRFNTMRDNRERYIGCYYLIFDRSDDVKKMNQEHYRATHDPLTGLLNREGFIERVRFLLNRAGDRKYVLLYSDIKDFKLVNDLFGIMKGDEILKHIAGRLEQECEEDDAYGRVGPDQFALCMPEERFYKERIIKFVDETGGLIDSSQFAIHIHVGIYRIEIPDEDVSLFCDRAAMAISTIKNNNNLVFAEYNEKIMNQVLQERRIISEFDKTIGTEAFRIHLQPQMDRDGKLKGAEALVRWIHPVRGSMAQEDFLPILEESGLLWKLDQYIWEEAAKQLRKWKNTEFENLTISVNISPRDFYYVNVYKAFTDLVEKYGIGPSKLNLEITETAFMNDATNQIRLVEKLKDYGFQVEMDDFGSGYSSLNMLKDMDVDVLKIDMGFLQDSAHEDKARGIIESVIEMARKLNMSVLAEGVETQEQFRFLCEHGCDLFQGYFFGKPVSVEKFEESFRDMM